VSALVDDIVIFDAYYFFAERFFFDYKYKQTVVFSLSRPQTIGPFPQSSERRRRDRFANPSESV